MTQIKKYSQIFESRYTNENMKDILDDYFIDYIDSGITTSGIKENGYIYEKDVIDKKAHISISRKPREGQYKRYVYKIKIKDFIELQEIKRVEKLIKSSNFIRIVDVSLESNTTYKNGNFVTNTEIAVDFYIIEKIERVEEIDILKDELIQIGFVPSKSSLLKEKKYRLVQRKPIAYVTDFDEKKSKRLKILVPIYDKLVGLFTSEKFKIIGSKDNFVSNVSKYIMNPFTFTFAYDPTLKLRSTLKISSATSRGEIIVWIDLIVEKEKGK